MTAPRPPRGRRAAAAAEATPPQATLTFKGTEARIALHPPQPVRAIAYDGVALAADRWHAAADGTCTVRCPPGAFDAAEHTLRLDLAGDALALALAFRSDYRWALDRLDERAIRGWIYDRLRPSSSLTLVVEGDSFAPFELLNTLDHKTLTAAEDAPLGGGFDIWLPLRPSGDRPEVLRIAIQGTAFEPFGPILRGTTPRAAMAAATTAVRALGREAAGLLAAGSLLPDLAARLTAEYAPPPPPDADAAEAAAALRGTARRLTGTLGLSRARAPMVDIVVPVYRGRDETLACLHSVLDSGGRIGHRVVAIDDASPEPELSAALQDLAREGRIVYLRNENNLGFVATANRGLTLPGGADVLLLNSDTAVPPGFLDRLYRAAYSDAAIATVTALSNNATICSLPLPPGTDGQPYGLDDAAIDAVCRTANAGLVRDIPTAHGFCMFVKRAAIDDVGVFDVARFGAGYGEENDYSLRAAARGWRNVVAGDVFVRHLGAVSFGADSGARIEANLRTLTLSYPHYHEMIADFLRTDPLHDLRNRVQKAAWQQIGRIVLLVTLSLEGGAERHVNDMMARLAAEGCLPLALSMARDERKRMYPVIRRWNSTERLRYPHPAPMAEALADILDLAPGFIHVQHLIDLPAEVGAFVRDCGIPYAVTLHDFFYACPRVTLLDGGGQYCGMPPAGKCTPCVRQGGHHAHLHPSLAALAADGVAWRAHWRDLLRDALHVIAPSRDTAERYAALLPGLTCDIRPHPAPAQTPAANTRDSAPGDAPGDALRVAVPGAIGPQKGIVPLIELARHAGRWADDVTFVVVGHTDRDQEVARLDNICVTGRFDPQSAVAALRASGCRVALFLSVFPETYSYTLSECLTAGLVPVAYDFGAIGERLRALETGVLVPPHAAPDVVIAAIRRAATLPPPRPAAAVDGEYGSLLGEYYAPSLTDLAESMPPPDLPRLLVWPPGVDADRWCAATVRLWLWTQHPVQRAGVLFWVPDAMAGQAVEIMSDNRTLARAFLDTPGICRVVVVLPNPQGRFLDLTCRFDFVAALQPPDQRTRAAMFSGVEIAEGAGWRPVELPGAWA